MTKTSNIPPRNDGPSSVKSARVVALAKLRASRKVEALNIYRPLPSQEPFHACRSTQRILRGGNRSGKTTSTMVETARAALGCDPHKKYPDRPLLIYMIGYDLDHNGRVFYRALFKPGLFKIVRDKQTGEWRAWDAAKEPEREKETRLSPPLIPKRCIEDIAWENKRKRVFSCVRLTNGTEIRCFSSKADPAAGDPVDMVVFDEDLENEEWVTEMQARLSDRKGRLIWGAKPSSDSRCVSLEHLSVRANDPENLAMEVPDIAEFILRYSDNPFMDADEKRKRRADFESLSEEEWAARDRGEFFGESMQMFPSFHVNSHVTPRQDASEVETELDAAIRLNGNQIPHNWTRYISIDPGYSICCCLFFAVPPPGKFGDHCILYDELYIKNCTSELFGRRMSEKAGGQQFQAFVIDDHGSRQTEAGSGKTLKQQYSTALQNWRVESEATGSGFINGSDDRIGRASEARNWMSFRTDGGPKFRFLKGSCPNFLREIPAYKRGIVKTESKKVVVLDVADTRTARLCHAMAAFEYMVAYNPKYVPPKKLPAKQSAMLLEHLEDQRREREEQGSGMWLGAGFGDWN